MSQSVSSPLLIEGDTARVVSPDRLVRIGDLPGLREVRRLAVPAHVETLFGLERFQHLQVLRYDGSADLLGFRELLDWLTAPAGNDEKFLTRVATAMRAGRPISDDLMVIIAPHMVPPHALESWDRLMELFDDVVSRSNGYGRQDVCLCALNCGQLKRLEYALYMGFALAEKEYPPSVARWYPPSRRFSGEDRLWYGLSTLSGRSYREFYAVKGEHDYRHIQTKDAYIAFLRKRLPLADTRAFQDMLDRLMDLGVLSSDNFQAALDLALERQLSETIAFLLERGRSRLCPAAGGVDALDAEFEL